MELAVAAKPLILGLLRLFLLKKIALNTQEKGAVKIYAETGLQALINQVTLDRELSSVYAVVRALEYVLAM